MSTDVMTNPKTTTKEKKRISTKIIAPVSYTHLTLPTNSLV